jgi:hypothetical protein
LKDLRAPPQVFSGGRLLGGRKGGGRKGVDRGNPLLGGASHGEYRGFLYKGSCTGFKHLACGEERKRIIKIVP